MAQSCRTFTAAANRQFPFEWRHKRTAAFEICAAMAWRLHDAEGCSLCARDLREALARGVRAIQPIDLTVMVRQSQPKLQDGVNWGGGGVCHSPNLVDLQARSRHLKRLQSGLGDIRRPDQQQLEFGQALEVCQARIADVRTVQVEILEPRQRL